jgi:hypothetical protein
LLFITRKSTTGIFLAFGGAVWQLLLYTIGHPCAAHLMTKDSPVTKAPMLRPRQVVTLSLKHSKIQATFDRYTAGDWSVQSSAGNIGLIEYATSLHVSFVHDAHVFSGLAKVLSVSPRDERVVLAQPARLKSRPMRKHQRVKVHLPCAVVTMTAQGGETRYTRRDEGSIVDLSEGGALIGCNSELPMQPRKLMMLFSIDANDPYNPGLQIYIPGQVVRRATEVKDTTFGFYYGVEFSLIVPTYRVMLVEFIELNGTRMRSGSSVKRDSPA